MTCMYDSLNTPVIENCDEKSTWFFFSLQISVLGKFESGFWKLSKRDNRV